MKLHLQVVSVLCTLLSPVCFSSLVGLNQKLEGESDEVVRIMANRDLHSATNFSSLPSSSVTITSPAAPHSPTSVQKSPNKDMSTSQSSSSHESTSLSSTSKSRGVVISTVTSTTKASYTSVTARGSSKMSTMTTRTEHVIPGSRTTTISPPGPYSPSSVRPTSSNIPHSPTTSTSLSQPTRTIHSTGCSPPVTVTVNNGGYCSSTPSPVEACSDDCTSKIGLSVGISIPGTAILTFLVTSLSCLCCQKVKKKHSYIQLAPTVYFDEEEHD